MKLPRWISIVSILAALVVPGGALYGIIPAKIAAVITGIAAIGGAFAHPAAQSESTPQK